MRGTAFGSVSIVGLFLVTVFPFLLSALAAVFSVPGLCFPICYAKAACFSFVSLGILTAFGSAGWLCCFLLLLRDWLGMGVLYLFWLRHMGVGRGRVLFREVAVYFVVFSLLYIMDCCFVSPFWADLRFL